MITHIRFGIEDCINLGRDRKILADDAKLVARIARIGREMGREPATPELARKIIGLKIQQQAIEIQGVPG